jgi:hypothetical protein
MSGFVSPLRCTQQRLIKKDRTALAYHDAEHTTKTGGSLSHLASPKGNLSMPWGDEKLPSVSNKRYRVIKPSESKLRLHNHNVLFDKREINFHEPSTERTLGLCTKMI